jgi:hypothetical protein
MKISTFLAGVLRICGPAGLKRYELPSEAIS